MQDYQDLTQLVETAEMVLTLEEMHGLLCGILITGKAVSVSMYIDMVTDSNGHDTSHDVSHDISHDISHDTSNKALGDVLGKLYDDTRCELQSPTLEFEPLLPDDDYPLDERMVAACSWARGLIIGLAKQGIDVQGIDDVSADSTDFIKDMYQVSQAEFQVAFDEESELVYSELVEYLKMGTLLLQEEFNPIDGEISPTLH